MGLTRGRSRRCWRFRCRRDTGGAGRRRVRSSTRSPGSSTGSWRRMKAVRRSSGIPRSGSSSGCVTSTATPAGSPLLRTTCCRGGCGIARSSCCYGTILAMRRWILVRRWRKSVPTAYCHREVLIRGYVHEVVISCGAEVIARHPRSYEREDFVYNPLDYLALLERKIGALDQAAPPGRLGPARGIRHGAPPAGMSIGARSLARRVLRAIRRRSRQIACTLH
jgi:hypothetical protein